MPPKAGLPHGAWAHQLCALCLSCHTAFQCVKVCTLHRAKRWKGSGLRRCLRREFRVGLFSSCQGLINLKSLTDVSDYFPFLSPLSILATAQTGWVCPVVFPLQPFGSILLHHHILPTPVLTWGRRSRAPTLRPSGQRSELQFAPGCHKSLETQGREGMRLTQTRGFMKTCLCSPVTVCSFLLLFFFLTPTQNASAQIQLWGRIWR